MRALKAATVEVDLREFEGGAVKVGAPQGKRAGGSTSVRIYVRGRGWEPG